MKKPILFHHGIIDSSDSFIVNGEKAPAIMAAQEGFDVWLGNSRGNKYSRLHSDSQVDPDKQGNDAKS